MYDHFKEVQLLNSSIDYSKPTQESSSGSQNPIHLKEGSTLTPIGLYRTPAHFTLVHYITFRSPARVYAYNQDLEETRETRNTFPQVQATSQVDYGLASLECHEDAPVLHNFKRSICKEETKVIWGLEIRELCHQLTQAYEKVVHFKKNLFTIPEKKVGKQFLAFMVHHWNGRR